MKICISQRSSKNRGSSHFLDQLSNALELQGHQIVDAKPDITLCSVNLTNTHRCPTVLRIDGIYYDRPRESMNKGIKSSLSKANGVIYQSSFSKKMVKHMLGLPKVHNAVIHNGVDRRAYQTLTKQKQSEHTFVSCAHWRVNKRPKEIASCFVEAAIPNSILYMIGEMPKEFIVKHPSVVYLGTLARNEVLQTYKNSDYMIHICHIDSCPNSVVEGLCAGLPVVCNNISGTPEVVGQSGIIADIDPAFDFHFVKSMEHLPQINRNNLIEAIRKIPTSGIVVDRIDLDIQTTAQQYIALFETVLSK